MKLPLPTRPFKWANLASHNAGVTVVIVGISSNAEQRPSAVFSYDNGGTTAKHVADLTPTWYAGDNHRSSRQR